VPGRPINDIAQVSSIRKYVSRGSDTIYQHLAGALPYRSPIPFRCSGDAGVTAMRLRATGSATSKMSHTCASRATSWISSPRERDHLSETCRKNRFARTSVSNDHYFCMVNAPLWNNASEHPEQRLFECHRTGRPDVRTGRFVGC